MKAPRPQRQTIIPAFPSSPSIGFVFSYLVSVGFFLITTKSCWDFQDVEKALAFYGTYHREPINQVIHFFGVPVILWTLVVISAHLALPGSMVLKIPGIPAHYFNMGTLWISLYAIFYLSIDVVGTFLYSPFLYMYYSTAIRWVAEDQSLSLAKDKEAPWNGTGRLIRWSCLFHFLSWYVQIHPGHKIVEGASPAVMANLGGALIAAPLFAFYEGVWAIGLRQGMQGQIQELIAQYTADLCSQGANMRVCASL